MALLRTRVQVPADVYVLFFVGRSIILYINASQGGLKLMGCVVCS